MSEGIIMSGKNNLENYYNEVCKSYGVSCKVLTKNKYTFSNKQEHYLTFGVNGVPEDLNVKDIYVRNERTNALFYPDYFVVKLDEDTDKLSVVEAAVSYCKTVEFLKKIYSEHGLPLPSKIRGDEIHGLKEYNSGRNNPALSIDARADFNRGIKKFFKQEKTRSKFLRKWRDFLRTDKFDRKASQLKMFVDFLKRDSQVASLDLLHETNTDLNTTIINEHEYQRFKEDIKKLYPEVLYAISDIEVQNEGFDVKHNKNKPIHKIKPGPFGKLVTYQAFCEECEKSFAATGYETIKDLNPAYYETRKLTYKEIDEPFIASVLNSIRFAYAKSDSLQTVSIPGINVVSYIDVPVQDMMNFVSLAKANKVPFYLDCFGKFGMPNLEKIRVVYSSSKDNIMDGIVSRMINEKFDLSHIPTSLDSKAPSLDKTINQARHLQLNTPPDFGSENKNIEL